MQALAEKTKIKKYSAAAMTVDNLILNDEMSFFAAQLFPVPDNIFDWVPTSTLFVAQYYIQKPSSKAKEYLKKIYNYQFLGDNWDNNGAVPPTMDIISKASDFIRLGDEFDLSLYFVAPGFNGEILVEYKIGENTAEIFFNEDGSEEMILYSGHHQIYADNVDIELLIKHLC